MPLVSVVIPVLNERRVLARCLDSVLAQTHPDLDVLIVIDTRSSDGSVDLCRDYAERDKRVRMVRDSGNVSTARNRGLVEAAGDFVQFVDADDSVDPRITAVLLGEIEREKVDWASCGALFIQEGSDDTGKKSHLPHALGRYDATAWLKRFADPADMAHSGVLWNKIYRMDVIRNHDARFHPTMTFCEDHIFNLDYLAACDAVFVGDEPLYHYREGAGPDGQLTVRRYHRQTIEFIDLYCRKLARLAAARCSGADLNALYQAVAGVAVITLVRFCRRDSPYSTGETMARLTEVATAADVQEWFAHYRPEPGQSRAVPFFLRRGWIRPLFYAARRRADRRYGAYYAKTAQPSAGTA